MIKIIYENIRITKKEKEINKIRTVVSVPGKNDKDNI